MNTIKEYEGIYYATEDGKIWSAPRNGRRGRYLRTGKNHKGYFLITLTKKGISKTYAVHRLIAKVFIQNPKKYPQVNHKNGIKTDNRIENLEWCTNRQNFDHALIRGFQSKKITPKQVVQIRKMYFQGKTQQKIGEIFHIGQDMVSKIVNRHCWSYIQ